MNPLTWPAGRRRAEAFAGDAWIVPYWTWAWAGWWRFLLRGATTAGGGGGPQPGRSRRRHAAEVGGAVGAGRCQALFTHAASLDAIWRRHIPGVPTGSYPFPPTAVGEFPDRDRSTGRARSAGGSAGGAVHGSHPALQGSRSPDRGDRTAAGGKRLAAVVAGEPWGGSREPLCSNRSATSVSRIGFVWCWVGPRGRGATAVGGRRSGGPALPVGIAIGGGADGVGGRRAGADHRRRRARRDRAPRNRRLVGRTGLGRRALPAALVELDRPTAWKRPPGRRRGPRPLHLGRLRRSA